MGKDDLKNDFCIWGPCNYAQRAIIDKNNTGEEAILGAITNKLQQVNYL